MALQLVFGMKSSCIAKYLQFDHRIIIKILNQDPMTKIAMASIEKMDEHRSLNDHQHPVLQVV